jgi:scyllo-inositol 2-dehydrogenase (NADP+)
MNKKIRVGIIGFGLSGRYLQGPFFEEHDGFELSAFVTKNNDPTLVFPKVKHYLSAEELISDPDIDLISVCSPNETHYTLTKQILASGKHVLVEKPFVADVYQAQELFDLADALSLKIYVFQNRRFDSDFLTIKKILESKELGELKSLDIYFHRNKPLPNPKKWKEIAAPSTGILYDLGSHILDQALSLFGRPKSWYGQVFTEREVSDIDDAFMIWLDYGDKKVCLRASMLVSIEQPRYILVGTKAMAVKYGIDIQEDQLKLGMEVANPKFGIEEEKNSMTICKDDTITRFETEKGNWMALFENLYQVIVNDERPIISRDQILLQIEILSSVKRQASSS